MGNKSSHNTHNPQYFLKIGRYYVHRLSGINFFSYLKPRKEYIDNVYLPLVMCMGEHHLSYSARSSYAGECKNCDPPSCVDMEKKELFDMVLEELSAGSPIDVYTETHYFNYKIPGNESGKLERMFEYARELHNRYPERIRSHSNDPRHFRKGSKWYESELLTHYEWTSENIEFLHYMVNIFTKGDYRSAAEFFFSRISSPSKNSVIWKELSKQDPNFLSVDGRQMNDISVWVDVLEILLRIHIDLQKFKMLRTITADDFIEVLEKIKPGDPIRYKNYLRKKIENGREEKEEDEMDEDEIDEDQIDEALYFLMMITFASTLDLYQLARMFKMQCVGSGAAGCTPSYAALAMIITGSQHSQSISSVLTNPFSPLSFYRTDLSIYNELYENTYSLSKIYNRDQELIDCIDFSLYNKSIDLVKDVGDIWYVRNIRGIQEKDRERIMHRYERLKHREIVRAPRPRHVFKKMTDFEEYLKNDSVLIYQPVPFEELLTTMPLEHLM